MQTEAQKRASKKWDDANMQYQTIKINRELLQEFKQVVQSKGERVNTVFKEFIERYIQENK